MSTPFGYLLVHFVESSTEHGEQVYFSLSEGDDPLRWRRVNGGRPVLGSLLGTTGVRDPHLVRGDGEFFLVATDLRMRRGGGEAMVRTGSRSIVVWRSDDLVAWSDPWLAEVAPPEAGMAWAPESLHDPATGLFDVFWASALYGPDDPRHEGDSYARILVSRTRDFRRFESAEVLVDLGDSVIDLTAVRVGERVHRVAKYGPVEGEGLMIFHSAGSGLRADDVEVLASGIGADLSRQLEGPLLFRDHRTGEWHLWLDRFRGEPGYLGFCTRDIEHPQWTADPRLVLPAATKHGGVLPLVGDEYARLAAAFDAPP